MTKTTLTICTLLALLTVAVFALAAGVENPKPSQSPAPAPAPAPLSAADSARLNDLDSQLRAKSEERQQAAAAYQQKVIEEQSLALRFSDQLRAIERMTCGVKEALTGDGKAGWRCLKIEAAPAAPESKPPTPAKAPVSTKEPAK